MAEYKIVDHGVDWITGTTLDADSSLALSLWLGPVVQHQSSLGNLTRQWGMAGFSGFQVGQVQFGKRGDELCVRLSGAVAQLNWSNLYQRVAHVTRLDLQITSWSNIGERKRVRNSHRSALAHASRRKKPPTVRLITGNDGSDTLYCGTRQSNQFGRIYSKGIQSKLPHYQNCVRHEVQYNGKASVAIAARLFSSKDKPRCILRHVSGFFRNRGCAPAFGPDDPLQICISRNRSDIERRLMWLRKSVRETAQLAVRMGYGPAMLEALGIGVDVDGSVIVSQ